MSLSSTTIHTSAAGLRHGLFDLPVADGAVKAYFAKPDGTGKFPVILVVQEIFGINAHIQVICRRFAHQGYLAVAVDLFQRQGDASASADIAPLVKAAVAQLPDEQVRSDLDASGK